MLCTLGSNQFLEISINQGNASQTLGIGVDADIHLLVD
jgi:S-adenosylmethionine hydrolase